MVEFSSRVVVQATRHGIPSLTSSSGEIDSGANLAPMISTASEDAAVDKMISREAVERRIFRARRKVYTH